jgi:hypothetical protein
MVVPVSRCMLAAASAHGPRVSAIVEQVTADTVVLHADVVLNALAPVSRCCGRQAGWPMPQAWCFC